MKARVISTGKIVEVTQVTNAQPILAYPHAMHIYADSNGTTYPDTDLDFINVYPDISPDIHSDKQQIRIQASIAAMHGMMAAISPERFTCRINAKAVAKASVEYADALIEELFKEL